jgi:hypothetical protein
MALRACGATEEKAKIAKINISLYTLANFATQLVLIACTSFQGDSVNFKGHKK